MVSLTEDGVGRLDDIGEIIIDIEFGQCGQRIDNPKNDSGFAFKSHSSITEVMLMGDAKSLEKRLATPAAGRHLTQTLTSLELRRRTANLQNPVLGFRGR